MNLFSHIKSVNWYLHYWNIFLKNPTLTLCSDPEMFSLEFVCVSQSVFCEQFFVNPWPVALQAPLFMEFSEQDYWSGLPFPSLESLLEKTLEPRDWTWVSCNAGRLFTNWVTREALGIYQGTFFFHPLNWSQEIWG